MILAMNVTFMGLTIIATLAILLAVIYALSVASKNKKKDTDLTIPGKENSAVRSAEEENISSVAAQSEEELIAVLTAAVASMTKRDIHTKLRVKSYRHISSNAPVWNAVSRIEQLSDKL